MIRKEGEERGRKGIGDEKREWQERKGEEVEEMGREEVPKRKGGEY